MTLTPDRIAQQTELKENPDMVKQSLEQALSERGIQLVDGILEQMSVAEAEAYCKELVYDQYISTLDLSDDFRGSD
jgi:galactitol-specific phosphotransferase system IIB component